MNRELVLNVGKLMVAVAWVDGILAQQEIEALRGLVAKIPGITPQEKAQIEVFMSHHVSDVEREMLVRLVADLIKTPEEKEMAMDCLRGVVACDGEVTADEEEALRAIEAALTHADVGVLRSLSRVLWRSVNREQQAGAAASREDNIDDFLRNRVFYYLMLDPRGEALVTELGEAKARLASLAAGLMLRVACIDWSEGKISEQEKPPEALIVPHLCALHGLAEEQAKLFVDIAWLGYTRGLDGFLLGCALEVRGSKDELHECFAALLAVAHEEEGLTPETEAELLDIAHALMFDQEAVTLSRAIYEHQCESS